MNKQNLGEKGLSLVAQWICRADEEKQKKQKQSKKQKKQTQKPPIKIQLDQIGQELPEGFFQELVQQIKREAKQEQESSDEFSNSDQQQNYRNVEVKKQESREFFSGQNKSSEIKSNEMKFTSMKSTQMRSTQARSTPTGILPYHNMAKHTATLSSFYKSFQTMQEEDEQSSQENYNRNIRDEGGESKQLTQSEYQYQFKRLYPQRNQYSQEQKNQTVPQQQPKKRRRREKISLRDIVREQENKVLEAQGKPRRKRRPRKNITQSMLNGILKLFKLFNRFKDKPSKDPNRQVTLSRIAQALDLSYTSIYKLYREFQYDNTLMSRFVAIKKKKLNQVHFDRLTSIRMQTLKKILQANPFLTQNQMVQHMNKYQQVKKHGKDITMKSIGRILKLMKFSKKKVVKIPKYRNTPQNVERRYSYCVFYKKIVDQKKRAYFLDQSALNLLTVRDSAWSQVGQPIERKIKFPQGKNVSLIAIMAQTGIVAFQIKNGNFRREHHLNFIEKFFNKLAQSPIRQQKQYLIMDNCRIHNEWQQQSIAQRKANIQIVKLPPYSPQLNPIENWFHEVKAKVRKTTFETHQQLMQSVKQVVSSYRQYDFGNYFSWSYKHTLRGLQRQHF